LPVIILNSPGVIATVAAVFLGLLAVGFYVHDRTARRLAWGGAVWLALSLGYLYTGSVPMILHRLPTDPISRLVVEVYDVAWWIVMAWLAVQAVNLLLWRWIFPGAQPGGRKLIADLLAAFIYLGAALGILAFTFEQDVSGVLATSGVVAIVLGFALQNSLGEIVSGLFMSVESPYRAGDWITVDDRVEGQVIETNWRATRLKTRTGDYLIMPNSAIAKAQIVNRYFPDRVHTTQIAVTIDARTPPDRAIAVLTAAALAAPGIRREPAPEVQVFSLSPKAIEYRVTYSIDDFVQAPAARSEVMRRIWRHLFWAGIRMDDAPVPAPGTAQTDAERIAALDQALAGVALVAPLSAPERRALAERYRTSAIGAGTDLVKQGNQGDSMFLISEGVLAVLVDDPASGRELEVTRLGPGDYFGEMSLLTGALRSATVRTLTDACVHELAKSDLAPVMAARPTLATELSRVLAARQKSLAEAGQQSRLPHDTEESYAERLASWIHAFFRA
jgi:small-conductance mechanosensitive channel/CRP-like cAMP-binding protein